MEFQTEVARLLDIVTHALYTDKEIFLRELISNASDACDRLRYEAIAKPELVQENEELQINMAFDAEARTLTISDNGIGMTHNELIKNLGTIAHSGTREILKNFDGGKDKDVNLIGQFGVGFYSAFMVAEKVEVLSRKAGDDKAFLWLSDGAGSYTVDEHLKDNHGTEITLHLKGDAGEFLLEERLKQVVKKYSDHISFPIILGGATVNKASALWARPKSEVTDDEYKEFYRHIAGGETGLDEPSMTLHWKAEGAFEYTNLLFVPSMRPFDLYDPRRHHGLKLFVKRVFITDGVDGLIPPFLRFLKGVVDSEDLPLNISREMLQNNPLVAKMSSAITRKVLGEFQKKAKSDPAAFEQFWALFGAVIKEGLYDAHAYRDNLCKVVHFYSSRVEGLTSLADYKERMKDGQEEIYYLSAPSVEAAQNSPQLEAYLAKDLEVLFMVDAIDDFWLPIQADFEGKKFKSITRGEADLSKFDAQEKPEEEDEANNIDNLLARMKEDLKEEVKDVRISERLVESPVCLVAEDNDVDINMQHILQKSQGYESKHQHILEINKSHPVIKKLEQMVTNDAAKDTLKETSLLLLDQARIVEGEPLKNPTEFVRRMSKAVERGLA